jgi:hypothetical protein
MSLNSTAGDAAAESYFSLVEAADYFTARGITAWTGTDAAKEAAARLGTQYLDNAYRNRWKGYRTNQNQALAWPRIGDGGDSRFRLPVGSTFFVHGLIDEDGFEIPTDVVPNQVKRAAMEAALMALSGTVLEPTLARGGRVKSVSKVVGPLSKSITYEDGAPSVDRYMVIDGYLRGLVTSQPGSGSGNVKLVRA